MALSSSLVKTKLVLSQRNCLYILKGTNSSHTYFVCIFSDFSLASCSRSDLVVHGATACGKWIKILNKAGWEWVKKAEMKGVEEEEMNLSCLVEKLSHVYCVLFLAVFYSSTSQNGSTCVLQELSRTQRLPSQYSAEVYPWIPPGAEVHPHLHFAVINYMISHGPLFRAAKWGRVSLLTLLEEYHSQLIPSPGCLLKFEMKLSLHTGLPVLHDTHSFA